MSMNKPESPERLPADRIVGKRRDKDAFRITYNYVGHISLSRDYDPHLTVYFKRYLCKIFPKFKAYQLAVKASPVDPLQRVYLTPFETSKFSVKYRYASSSKNYFTTSLFPYIIVT